ncbi:MAG TPA: STAS domain-containing protein [Pyrinomonadaceae bacterium]|nr:STAS domain-containing protein [Pyrinomonadaceae bacterium]
MLKVQARSLGSVAILRLDGQIVNGETEILRHAVRALSETSVVKLDLASVTTVDARGLGVMLELREWTQAMGIRFELLNVTRRIAMLLELTRLDSVFHIAKRAEFLPATAHSRIAQGAAIRLSA